MSSKFSFVTKLIDKSRAILRDSFRDSFWFHVDNHHNENQYHCGQVTAVSAEQSCEVTRNQCDIMQKDGIKDARNSELRVLDNYSETVQSGQVIQTISQKSKNDASEASCLMISVYSAVVIALVCLFVFAGRDYIKFLLLSLKETNICMSFLVFIVLFTIVSLPMTWGYILLNIAAGYLYGLLLGIIIIVICAFVGSVFVHVLIRNYLRSFVASKFGNDTIRAIMRVVESQHGFKIVFLSRLTPIPFGLQNALFAVSRINTPTYLFASLCGMCPTQGMHAYIGSTLRSMEEVISDSSNSTLAYLIFGAQLLAAVGLLLFMIRKAKMELDKAVSSGQEAIDGRCDASDISGNSSNLKISPDHIAITIH